VQAYRLLTDAEWGTISTTKCLSERSQDLFHKSNKTYIENYPSYVTQERVNEIKINVSDILKIHEDDILHISAHVISGSVPFHEDQALSEFMGCDYVILLPLDMVLSTIVPSDYKAPYNSINKEVLLHYVDNSLVYDPIKTNKPLKFNPKKPHAILNNSAFRCITVWVKE
jgi:hypothetical protein